jgi:hypothetical protein
MAAAVVLVGGLGTVSAFALTRRGNDAKPSSPVTIAVVGDAYSAGVRNRVVWPTPLAQRTGWSVANFALPDAGFAADDRGGQSFVYQVERAHGAARDQDARARVTEIHVQASDRHTRGCSRS